MKTKFIESQIKSSYINIQKLFSKNGSGCYRKPIVPSDCPTFDEATSSYIREQISMYIEYWVLPSLEACLREIGHSGKGSTSDE